jgi:D-alanyl-D-alanine carboxypeptidase
MLIPALLLAACSRPAAVQGAAAGTPAPNAENPASETPASAESSTAANSAEAAFPPFSGQLRSVLDAAEIPGDLSRNILTAAAENPAFIMDLLICLEGDPYLRRLVDKSHALPGGYEPDDLVRLTQVASYRVDRDGLRLRRAAAVALETMAAAAEKDGVTFIVSSTYRSYDYQVEVYGRIVKEMGQAAADRESAPPGRSQHQTGLVADFYPIDDAFAETPAGRWMAVNAGRYGWSLSFPDGYEAVTGYRWESWHYRYVGRDLADFIDNYFAGIQQYALRFLHEWEKASVIAAG